MFSSMFNIFFDKFLSFLFFYLFLIPCFYSVGIISGIRKKWAYSITAIIPLFLLMLYYVNFPFFEPDLYHEKVKTVILEGYTYVFFSYLLGLFLGLTGLFEIRNLSFPIFIGACCSFVPESYLKFKLFINKRAVNIENKVKEFRFGDGDGFLTDRNLSLHTQVIGGSGVGKTNFLKNFIADRVSRGRGVIFLDFKADFEVLEWMKSLMNECGREDFKCLMLSRPDSSIPYNPIRNGSPTEITSQLMNSFSWSEEFYKNYSENVLLMAFNILCYLRDEEDLDFHLGHLHKLLSSPSYRNFLLRRSQKYEYIDEVSSTFSNLDARKGMENISGLLIQLKKIIFSSAGKILTSNLEDYKSLDLRESIENGDVVYIFMNSMSLKDVASTAGKMILQDLMKEVGKIYDNEESIRNNVSIVIDEFASFATPDFVGFIDKVRGANIELMISHQSMGDLREISENFGTRIFENTASKVIFNTQSSEDAEYFAGALGTFETVEDTDQIKKGIIFSDGTETGLGSRRVVEKFKIHPNVFKELIQGEAVVMGSKVDVHFGKTSIFKAFEFGRVEKDISFLEKNVQKYLSLEEVSMERSGEVDSIDMI